MATYTTLWENALPFIISNIIKNGGEIQLSADDFTSAGKRNTYSFRITIVCGNVTYLQASAVARDLKTVLEHSDDFQSLAKDRLINITMGHSFVLEITSEKVCEKGKLMKKQEFISNLRKQLNGKVVYSVADNVPYRIEEISVGLSLIRGVRESTGNAFEIDINELLEAYNECERPITTTKLREYITGRVYSPSLAILRALDDAIEEE